MTGISPKVNALNKSESAKLAVPAWPVRLTEGNCASRAWPIRS